MIMKKRLGLALAAIVAAPSAYAGQVLTSEVKVYDLLAIGMNSGSAVLPIGPNLLVAPVVTAVGHVERLLDVVGIRSQRKQPRLTATEKPSSGPECRTVSCPKRS